MKIKIPKAKKAEAVKKYQPKHIKIKEAFSAGSHKKVIMLMGKIFNNRLKSQIEFDFDFPDGYIANGEKFRSYTGYFKNGKSMKINFLLKDSDYVHSFYICDKKGKVIEAYEFEFDTPIPQVIGTIVDYCKGDLEIEGEGGSKEESIHTLKKIGNWLKEAAEEERAKIFQNWLLNSADKNQHMQMVSKDNPKKFYKNFVISTQKEFPEDFSNKYFPDSNNFVKLVRAYVKMNSIQNPNIRFRTVKRGKKPTELKPMILPEEQAFVPMVTGGPVAPAVIDWRNEFAKLQKNLDILISEKKFAPYGLIIWGNGGTGKAQPLYSKVLTPNGFTTMKEIKVGDQVLTPSGEKANVVQIHPQDGLRPIYEVTFSDGSKTRCDENHLWKVFSGEILSLKTIITLMEKCAERFLIPQVINKEIVWITITSISFIGNEEAKCITIDSPDQLYITDDFIVTHNSFYINKVVKKLGNKAVIKKGAFTWAGFVEILYNHRNLDLIVFDDADRVVTDADCRMMLKQALDDTVGEANDGIRKVNPPKLTAKMKNSWELNEDGTFNFAADIVIITNLDKVYDSALWSRMWKSPIFMTKREIIEKIEETSKDVIKAMGCTAEQGHMVANYISNLLESGVVTVNDDMMSYRVFKRGLQMIKHDPMGWMGSLNTEFGYGVRMTLKPDKAGKKPEAPVA